MNRFLSPYFHTPAQTTMSNTIAECATIAFEQQQIEIHLQWIAHERRDAPLVVFLHEGLGSLEMWEAWPHRFCEAIGARGLIFSRYGYGKSTARPEGEPWPLDYLEREAREALPALFASLGIDPRIDKPILFGHSDGGTIALLYAAAFPDAVAAVIAVAPHVMVEEVGVHRIEYLRQGYDDSAFQRKLKLFHSAADAVFRGWSDVWLSPTFRDWNISQVLPKIQCPVFALQGAQDQYGTLDQVRIVHSLVQRARLKILDECRHVPHQDQPQILISEIASFLGALGIGEPADRMERNA